MATIQLIGKEQTLKAFEAYSNKFECEDWALYSAKQQIVHGTGVDELEEWLDMFTPSGTIGTYTLRLYRDQARNGDYSASFNFKLQDMYNGSGMSGFGTKIEARIAALEGGKDADEDEESLGSLIYGLFKEPAKLRDVVGAFMQIKQPQSTMGAIDHQQHQEQQTQSVQSATDGDIDKLAAILDRLGARDPKLITHLEKLSALDDTTFAFVMSKVDSL